MPHKLRKVRKLRGSRQHGFGHAGHRKSGSRGGKGMAGTHKHEYVPPGPKFEGKHGFKRKGAVRAKAKVLNVGELDRLAARSAIPTKEEGGRALLDLDALGYAKILGKGAVKNAYVVVVGAHSKAAAKKVIDAGGEVRAPAGA
ncbi:MAG: uL15 family ribosomal protein [Candidatus Brockarchaeota archaeon]|nr:uL15 family ribosomal protein [Candidatus Brockarchaeota archaeon]